MDLVEVLSNLHALRQLYELLQNIDDDDDLQDINSNNVHQTLDPRARKLFKHLLDDATEKMFHTHLKIIEAQSVEKTPCSSRLEQPKAMPKLQAPFLPDTVNSSLNHVLSNQKDSKSSMTTSNKDEQYPVKCQSGISRSKVSTSSDVPQYKKKRCRACIAKEMRKQYSTKEATASNERVDQQRDRGGDSVSSCVDKQAKRLQESNSKAIEGEKPIDETLPSSVPLTTGAAKQEAGYTPIGEMKKMSDESNDFAKVVTNAICQIESCILALKLSSDLARSSINNDVDEHVPFKLSISVSPVEHRKEDGITRQAVKQTEMGESSMGKGTQLTQVSQKHREFAKSVPRGQGSQLENHMKISESLSRSASQKNYEMEGYINRVRVSPSPNQVTMKPPMQLKTPDTLVQTSETRLVQNRTARKRTSRYNSSMPPQSMGSMVSSVGGGLGERLSQTRRRKTENRHDQQMMRPVFLDDDDMPSQRRSHKMSYVGSGRKLMPRQEESEEENSSSSSRSMSTWTSKQNESSGSSCSNYSEESWSPRNDDFSESESNSQEGASSSYPSFEEDRSRLTDSVESDYSHKRYPDKSIGRLRKIKNRLGLIFHHHHHHGNDRSTWKRVQKMFHQTQAWQE